MKLVCFLALLASIPPVGASPAELEGHKEYVYEISFSWDGTLMATAAGDNTGIVWDLNQRKIRHVLKHDAAVYTARISPDGRTVATGCGDGFVALWDTADGRLIRRAKRHGDAVYAVAYSPDGRLLASAGGSTNGGDSVCRILGAADLALVKELVGHRRQVYGITFSPDGKTVATGSSDKTVCLWDVGSGSAKVLRGHTSDVYRGAFSPDGKRFATPSQDGSIRLWLVESGDVLATYPAKPRDPLYSIVFSRNGGTLAAVGDDCRLRILRAEDLHPVSEQDLSKKALYAVAFHPLRDLLAAAGEDGKIYFVEHVR